MLFLQISAFNTRKVKDPNMFVRTHVVYYFISLLLSDILQGAFISILWHLSLGVDVVDEL